MKKTYTSRLERDAVKKHIIGFLEQPRTIRDVMEEIGPKIEKYGICVDYDVTYIRIKKLARDGFVREVGRDANGRNILYQVVKK